jgi:hypothetical protein
MEDAACAPLPHHIRNVCFLPSRQGMGYPQWRVYDICRNYHNFGTYAKSIENLFTRLLLSAMV